MLLFLPFERELGSDCQCHVVLNFVIDHIVTITTVQ